MTVRSKRILAAAAPILLAAIAFLIGDAIVVRKYVGSVQQELEQATGSLRGDLLDLRRDVEQQLMVAAAEGPEAVDAALGGAGLGGAHGWVISTPEGVVITESGQTLSGTLGTRGDVLFDVTREQRSGSDLTVGDGTLMVRAYARIGHAPGDDSTPADAATQAFLGVLLPAADRFTRSAGRLLGEEIDYAFYVPGETYAGDPSLSVELLAEEARFFDRITASKSTGFRRMGGGGGDRFVAAAPVFDFEQWEIHGFVLASRPAGAALSAIRGSRIAYLVVAILAIAIATLGMSRLVQLIEAAPPRVFQSSEQRRRLSAQMLLLGALVVVPSAFGIGWAMVRSNADTATVMSRPIGAVATIAGDLSERAVAVDATTDEELDSLFSEMQHVTGAHYTLVRGDGGRVSTLREERAQFPVSAVEVWKEQDGVRTGVVRINYVVHRVAIIPAPELGGTLYATVEDTPYQNLLASSNAKLLTIVVVLILVVTASVWVVSSVHRERTFRLALAGFLFITPALVILLWWAVGPLLFSLFLTFHRWSIINPAKPFVGFANYIRMFNDELWWQSLVNTGYYALHIPVAMIVSLLVAMAMNRDMRGITVFRTIFYLPTVNSLVVTALMWKLIFNPEFGLLNYLLSLVGLPGLSWLSHPATAMPSIMLVSIWFAIGGQMILFLAGLKSIPKTYYEVADIDGTPGFAKFWYITLPLLRPTLLFVLITSTIASFQVFTQVYMLTQGGPAGSTDVAMYRLYTEAWYNLRMGYGATQAFTLSVIIFLFTAFQFRFFSREIKYS